MSLYKDYFRGKKITLTGLGLLGRGLGDAIFLAECGADLMVTDLRDEKTLAPSLAKLKKFKNIKYFLGGHQLEDFSARGGQAPPDFILKAAGVPLDSPFIAEARKNHIPVHMSSALFAQFAREAGATIVGVTGTRGKSTVTHLMYHTLKKAGKRVHLGGNVQGVSTLALLPKIKKGDICVLELDSWQLQGFGELHLSPHVAVFTNLQNDHLNYYRGNREAYFADKANIFRFQKKGDVLVAGEEVSRLIKKAHPPIAPFVPAPLPEEVRLRIVGAHNRENAGLAAAALCLLGVSKADMRKGLESFKPVDGRLQFLRTVRGIKIYNDNNATTPEATIAALKALSCHSRGGGNPVLDPRIREDDRKIILIMGGTDKGLDMSTLVEEIPKYCKAVILLKEIGTKKLLSEFPGLKSPLIKGVAHSDVPGVVIKETLKECVEEAMKLGERGDTILFSPAFASFGKWFKNEYDRGEQFVELVKKL